MYYCVELACVIMEMWMLHRFLSGFYESRNLQTGKLILFYLISGIFLTVLSLIEHMEYTRILFTTLCAWLAGILLFKARHLPALIAGVVYCTLFAATDIITALLFQLVHIPIDAIMFEHTYRILYLIASHVVMFGLIMGISFFNRSSRQSISLKILLSITPLWLISLFLCLLLTWEYYENNHNVHPVYFIILLGLQYTNIIMIHYSIQLQNQAQEREAWVIAEHHYAMQQEYYDQLRIQQEETRALWHDISKYLRAATLDSTSSALVQVQEMLNSIPHVVDVNNRVVSVILNEYVNAVQSTGIQLKLDVQVPDVLFVTAADLYVLIGNTMDNAIEACKTNPPELKIISLKLRTHNQLLFYEISNPFSGNNKKRVRNQYHGFGLKNVTKVVEKYQGKIEISRENNSFCVSVFLNSL